MVVYKTNLKIHLTTQISVIVLNGILTFPSLSTICPYYSAESTTSGRCI